MEYIEKVFKKSGFISILKSIFFTILGIILVCKPGETLKEISCILGIIFITIGIFKIINYFSAHGRYDFYNYDLVYGLIAIVIGLITMIFSNTISSIFRIIIGIWIIYNSVIKMSLAFKLKDIALPLWTSTLLLAILMFICGIYITLNSGAILVTIGTIIIIYSIIDIIDDIIFMKNIKDIF